MDEELLATFYEKSSKEVLEEIKSYNNINSLIFSGEYNKDFQGKGFGFFTNILNEQGSKLKYPLLDTTIEEIYIATNELENNSRYSFLVEASNKYERVKKLNPFILSAKFNSVKEIFELTDTMAEVKLKKDLITRLDKKIIDVDDEFKIKANQIEESLLKQRNEKENELNQWIEEQNQIILEKSDEINLKEKSIIDLNITVSKIESEILESTNKKKEMEVTLNYLRSKIDICKNLDFLSIEDSDKYLQILSPELFEMGENYLDFEKDLAADFPQLVTHIQNFLYHKKDLIYTAYATDFT